MFFRRPARQIIPSLAVAGALMIGCTALSAAEPDYGGLDVIKLRPNFYMIGGAGGNIAVQIGTDGVVLVDSGSLAEADRVSAALKKITDLPIRYIINTNAEADHVGGNGKLAKTGQTIFTNALGNAEVLNAMTNGGAASILAHDSVLRKVSAPTGQKSPHATDVWPTEAFFQNRKYIRMNGEAVEILYQPNAHSDADSFVMFRGSDIVVAGDILDTTRFPNIDIANGGSIQGEIASLNKLIELAVPSIPFIYHEDATYVIPGHGRAVEQQDLVDYRDMVVIVRDVVADMIKKGRTLDQIQTARPALPFETQYGRQPGVTKAFIETIYKSLTAKK